jgi:hypothetical protein
MISRISDASAFGLVLNSMAIGFADLVRTRTAALDDLAELSRSGNPLFQLGKGIQQCGSHGAWGHVAL